MRIALDFDGTIFDLLGAWIDHARERYGVDIPPDRAWLGPDRYLDEHRHREIVLALVTSELTLDVSPLPDAREAMTRLAADHELFIVTARHEEEGRWAERWLDHHSIAVQGFAVTSRGPKLEACRAFGASLLLDDSPAVIEELHGSDVTPVLMDAPYNRAATLPPGVTRVEGWPAFETLCAELDAAG